MNELLKYILLKILKVLDKIKYIYKYHLLLSALFY